MSTLDELPRPDWLLEHYLQYIPLDNSPFIVGRDADCGLTLALGVISRNHAEFTWNAKDKSWMLRDLGSTNGTYINDKQVGDVPAKLMSGDFVRFASVEVRLLYNPHVGTKVSSSKLDAEPSKRTDVLDRLPDRSLTMQEKIERAVGNIIRQGNCTAQDLADTLNVERSTLYRHVHQEFGQSPSQLLRSRRFDYAAELLKGGKYSVQQVAQKTGFDSPAHFSRAFKQYHGVVPSHYAEHDAGEHSEKDGRSDGQQDG